MIADCNALAPDFGEVRTNKKQSRKRHFSCLIGTAFDIFKSYRNSITLLNPVFTGIGYLHSEAKIRRKSRCGATTFCLKSVTCHSNSNTPASKQGCFHIISVENQWAHNTKLCLVSRNIECVNNCGNTQCCAYAFTD